MDMQHCRLSLSLSAIRYVHQQSIPHTSITKSILLTSVMEFEQPKLQNDGKVLLIFFNEECSSLFHAIWLWQNSRSNIMIPSGQRKHSPGNYNGKASILAAAIHHCSFIKDALDHPSFLTKRGAVHPVNIDNNTNHNDASNNANSKSSNGKKLEDLSHFVLFIYWNQAISTESNSDEMNKRSIFNLQWLKDWAYDVQSLQSSRLKREVSVDHSFIQKYKHAIEEKQQLDIQRRAAYKGLASVDYDDIVNQPSRDGLLGFLDVSTRTLRYQYVISIIYDALC